MCSVNLLLAAGTAITAGSQVAQGINAANIGEANAAIQYRLARDARDRGRAEEQDARLRGAAIKGEQAAKFAASGGEVGSGSSLDILGDTAAITELDALRVRNNAEREAFGYEAGAAISRAQGRAQRATSLFGAVGTALTGGSQVAARWKRWQADNPQGSFGSFLVT